MNNWGISFDPGINLGFAIWEGTSLRGGGVARAQSGLRTFLQIKALLPQVPVGAFGWIATEEMEFRPRDPESQPDALIKVSTIGGYIAGYLTGPGNVPEFCQYRPSEWLGSVPKTIVEHRATKLAAETHNAEAFLNVINSLPKGSRDHFYAALGIGAYHLKLTSRGYKLRRKII